MSQEIYLSSRTKRECPIYLTEEEIEAIPIILNMALTYAWELYDKKEGDRFYEQHKENINKIKEYHNKGYQGILAVGFLIAGKCSHAIKNKRIGEILDDNLNVK